MVAVGHIAAIRDNSGVHTFYWNGTTNGSYGDVLPAGTYTFEVTATQTDENVCLNCYGIPPEPPCIASDEETYRSEYLKIIRASDESGNPIYDVEYDGYDDNNTPGDESDDKYIYIIRKYVLTDSLGVNASAGVIWLYDPEGEMFHDWNIAEQDCILHTNGEGAPLHDGLHATADGLEHALRIRVPISEMEYAGTYRFVLHIKDGHSGLYRNGVDRWSLDLNAEGDQPGAIVWVTSGPSFNKLNTGYNGAAAWRVLSGKLYNPANGKSQPGYKAFRPLHEPRWGGSGVVYGKGAHDMLRSLNRLCLLHEGDRPADAKYFLRENQVWVFYGHAFPQGISFNHNGPLRLHPPVLYGDGIMNCQAEDSDIFLYNINHPDFDLHHVRLAFLCGCFSAGGNSEFPGTTIAESFKAKGAQSVVGWTMKTYPHTQFYRDWLACFWDQVCKKGKTIKQAVDFATNNTEPSDKDLKKTGQKKMPAKLAFPRKSGHRV